MDVSIILQPYIARLSPFPYNFATILDSGGSNLLFFFFEWRM